LRRATETALEAVVEQDLVGQLGERVVEGEIGLARLVLGALARIGEHRDEAGGGAVLGAQGIDGQEFGMARAGFTPVPQLALPVSPGQKRVPHGLGAIVRLLAGGGEVLKASAPDLLGPPAGDPAVGPIDRDDGALRIGHHDRVGHAVVSLER